MIVVFLGLYEARRALEMLNNYPFRPEAVNSIIQVDANTREYNVLDKYSVSFYNLSSLCNILKSLETVFKYER